MTKSSPPIRGTIIAVTGKGGTGKTVISALMLKHLVRKGNSRILAIDADSAVGLPYALGLKVDKTVGQLREEVINDPVVRKEMESQHMREVMRGCLQRGEGYDLLVMGRGEGPGCFCAVNDLLRYGIEALSKEYDVVIVDGEAGPEQVNRRVVQKIDVLVIVTDTSRRGFHASALICEIAGKGLGVNLGRGGLVINRVSGGETGLKEMATSLGLEIFGYVPNDVNVADYDLQGQPIFCLPDYSPCVVATADILKKMGL